MDEPAEEEERLPLRERENGGASTNTSGMGTWIGEPGNGDEKGVRE